MEEREQAPQRRKLTEEERRRRARIKRKRQQMLRRRRQIQMGAAAIILILLVILLVRGCSGGDKLEGTWDYDGNTVYQFDGKGTGKLILPMGDYEFIYTTQEDQLSIDFTDPALRDGSYTYTVSKDELTLTGDNTLVFHRIKK